MKPAALQQWRNAKLCHGHYVFKGGVGTMIAISRCELREGHLGRHTSKRYRELTRTRGWAR